MENRRDRMVVDSSEPMMMDGQRTRRKHVPREGHGITRVGTGCTSDEIQAFKCSV